MKLLSVTGTTPIAMDISQLVKTIDAAIASLAQAPPSDEDRQQLLAASKRLQEASESPLDILISIVLGVGQFKITLPQISFSASSN